jgi:hypothetical protein
MIVCHNKNQMEKFPVVVTVENNDNVSSLSSSTSNYPPLRRQSDPYPICTEPVDCSNKTGSRPKGSTKAAIAAGKANLLLARTEAAKLYAIEKSKAMKSGATLKEGTLKSIVEQVEKNRSLTHGTLPVETIRSRSKRDNLLGVAWQRTSPLELVEPLLVQYCCKLANIGSPLCKEQVIGLMESLIYKSIHYDNLVEFKKRLKLHVPMLDDEGDRSNLLGRRWYDGFLKRNSDKIIRGKGRIKDIKRHTWCTYGNFVDMYDSVYNAMCLAKVAVKLDEETMFNIKGERVETPDLSFGRPTKYQVVRPEQIVFVDETGCNTSQKEDGNVGGQRFILPKECVTSTWVSLKDLKESNPIETAEYAVANKISEEPAFAWWAGPQGPPEAQSYHQ